MKTAEQLISESMSSVSKPSDYSSPVSRKLTPGKPLWDFPESDSNEKPVKKIRTAESFFDML